MPINYLAIIVCAVLAMVVGALWYGPLFGKKWMTIVKADPNDIATRAKMKKNAGPLYFIQFILVLFQIWILAYYIQGWKDASGLENSLWIWAAFIMPTIAATAMWNNDSAKVSGARFLIQSGYQLVVFVMFWLILGNWK